MVPSNYLCKLPLSPATAVMASFCEAVRKQIRKLLVGVWSGGVWLRRIQPSPDDLHISILSTKTVSLSSLKFIPLPMKDVCCAGLVLKKAEMSLSATSIFLKYKDFVFQKTGNAE